MRYTPWHNWFAWYPVRTLGGHLVWLTMVQRRWDYLTNFRIIDVYDRGDYAGGWEYKLLPDMHMKANLIYLALMGFISLVQALVIGAVVSLIDSDLGIITVGVVFGWQFIELISKRKSKW